MIEGIASSIQVFVESLGDKFLPLAMALSTVGVATMAFIQMAREIFPIRRKFHEFQARRWFDQAAAHVQKPEVLEAWKKAGVTPPDPANAFHQFVRLTTAGDAGAVLSLEIEQLAGQMAAASRVAVDSLSAGPDFLHCLAAHAYPSDLADAEKARTVYASLSKEDQAAAAEARARVQHFIQRAIDGFQVSVSHRWKLWHHVASLAIGFAIVYMALTHAGGGKWGVAGAVLISIVAAFVAPVSKDLVAALQQLRKK
ncbi:MAG: hypothetical protein A2V83_09360 [Nitrospirae bacterium RBG_16_64_22]|nr:MAG: hypothetical protein A2V83_09360 [Nitrospirae bacterium RBG_16_64_22]